MALDDEFRFRCAKGFKDRFDKVVEAKGHPWDRSKLAVDVLTKYCEMEEKLLGIQPPPNSVRTRKPNPAKVVLEKIKAEREHGKGGLGA